MSVCRADLARVVRQVSLLAGLGLSACGGVSSAIAPAPLPTYDLAALKSVPVHGQRAARTQLVVAEPSALRWLDNERLVVKPSTGEITYLSGAQWPDRLPRLLQARMVQSFENARMMKLVGRPGEGLNPDYQLISEVRSFEINAATSEAVIELSVRLLSARTGRIVAGEVLVARAPVSSIDGQGAAAAFNVALDKLLRDLIGFTARNI